MNKKIIIQKMKVNISQNSNRIFWARGNRFEIIPKKLAAISRLIIWCITQISQSSHIGTDQYTKYDVMHHQINKTNVNTPPVGPQNYNK